MLDEGGAGCIAHSLRRRHCGGGRRRTHQLFGPGEEVERHRSDLFALLVYESCDLQGCVFIRIELRPKTLDKVVVWKRQDVPRRCESQGEERVQRLIGRRHLVCPLQPLDASDGVVDLLLGHSRKQLCTFVANKGIQRCAADAKATRSRGREKLEHRCLEGGVIGAQLHVVLFDQPRHDACRKAQAYFAGEVAGVCRESLRRIGAGVRRRDQLVERRVVVSCEFLDPVNPRCFFVVIRFNQFR